MSQGLTNTASSTSQRLLNKNFLTNFTTNSQILNPSSTSRPGLGVVAPPVAAAQPIRHGLLGVHQHLQREELGGHQHLHQRPHHARVLAGVEEAGGAAEVADPAHRIGQGSDNDPTIGGPPTRAGEKTAVTAENGQSVF